MPCPHNEISIVQRSQQQSAVAAAAYQSGEKLFCGYDQEVKHYPEKRGIVHNEILLPANAPRSYADRNTLWNAAEAVEKQWNSQLARRWVLTIPREIPPDQYAALVRDFCNQQFVSKGMCVDFAIHDKGDGNPHAHVMLTMRAMDEHGKWLPKSRKVYDLDENGERIKLPSGRWKSHKEDTVDWNDRNLPVPQAEYINEVLKPSETQEEMVSSFADRAEAVRNGNVNPRFDNMLKITNDGRKLALDQRLINDMLPDEPESKVNRCVENTFKVWEESAPDKGTQLIFCDLSTPKADGTFNVYDDVREKLVARGVPREEVAFIHEYNTETKKAELFAKVRAGQVRILMGSTPKLGAGTNIQDRLIALHHLDCPWKPSDLEQQEGRILRQGNRNKQVKIYRYVTENTFDSYMWQILENKQKFISQIMTSKSPVRACDDVDDTALSYAEIKALATGNPYIKEKMDLDIQVSKLKLLKANHTSQIYSLESDIARRYPREITAAKGQIEALKTDIEAAKPLLAQDKDHFAMEISGKVYTERKEAGAAIIEACKALKAAGTEGRIGSYGAFELHSRFDNFDKVFRLSIKGAWNYSMEVGKDPQGNILRVTNALAGIERTLPQVERRLETLEQQLAQAKEEAKRPFAQEAELAEKSARLAELNSLLNMDEKGSEDALGVDEDAAETEVADKPRQPVNYAGRVAERTADDVRKPSVLTRLHAKQAERTAEPQKSQKRKSHDMEL